MKVKIDQNGNLIITPETDIENYALDKWHQGYLSNGKETLEINLFSEGSISSCIGVLKDV